MPQDKRMRQPCWGCVEHQRHTVAMGRWCGNCSKGKVSRTLLAGWLLGMKGIFGQAKIPFPFAARKRHVNHHSRERMQNLLLLGNGNPIFILRHCV